MPTRYTVATVRLTVRSGGMRVGGTVRACEVAVAATRDDRRYRLGVDRSEAARELGVPAGAAPALVEKAFRRAARSRHPDVGGDAVAFRRATEARAVLLRPRPVDPMDRVVQVLVRYHPVVKLVEALARAVERRSPAR